MSNELTVRRLTDGELATYGPRISAIERGVTYPFGDDRFEIDHGKDYFAFFRRLRGGPGRPAETDDLRVYVAETGGELLGVLVAVRRGFPVPQGVRTAWYLCDLKRARRPGVRGVATPLLDAFRADAFVGEPRAFAIHMLPAGDRGSPLLRFMKRELEAPDGSQRPIAIFALDSVSMNRALPILKKALGPIGFLSLAGVKDLVLASSGRPMPILHLQHGPFALPGGREPVLGATHMFALPMGHPTVTDLLGLEVSFAATAVIVGRGVKDLDPTVILTSDL